jgi:uncharacterized HAD superfamily protein
MRIGIDLDGVVVDSIPTWIRVLNRGAGTEYKLGELPDTYATPERGRYCEQHELEMLIAPPPVLGAARGVSGLKGSGHQVIVVTARAPRLRQITEAWLEYYNIAVDGMHFLEGRSKAPIAKTERLDFFVEDDPKNALAPADVGVRVGLLAAPYNTGVEHELVTRCDGWPEVVRFVNGRNANQLRVLG